MQQENLGLPAQLVRQERRVKMARLVQLVAQDQRARPDLLARLEKLVRRETRVLRALRARLDRQAPLGQRDQRAPQE